MNFKGNGNKIILIEKQIINSIDSLELIASENGCIYSIIRWVTCVV